MPQVPGGDNSESSDTSTKIDESLEYSPPATEPVSMEPQPDISPPVETTGADSDEYNNDDLDAQQENESTEIDSLEDVGLRQKHVSTAERRKVSFCIFLFIHKLTVTLVL